MVIQYNYFDNQEIIDHQKALSDVPASDKKTITLKKFEELINEPLLFEGLTSKLSGNKITLLRDKRLAGYFSADFLFTDNEYTELQADERLNEFCNKYLMSFVDRLALDEETGELYDIDENEPASFIWHVYYFKAKLEN